MLLDYSDIIVHIFDKENRLFYEPLPDKYLVHPHITAKNPVFSLLSNLKTVTLSCFSKMHKRDEKQVYIYFSFLCVIKC
ncbi:MAG: RsfS/YbeB/iojap family protein [Lachnospiraceae bacterium]|nr:RsfS/YbeB/iojap family protein [Lachnospiraceae bacterium]